MDKESHGSKQAENKCKKEWNCKIDSIGKETKPA